MEPAPQEAAPRGIAAEARRREQSNQITPGKHRAALRANVVRPWRRSNNNVTAICNHVQSDAAPAGGNVPSAADPRRGRRQALLKPAPVHLVPIARAWPCMQ
ncbi:hypothetical protein DI396_01690 [Litorivita pollutaquae]|uniref:Uncharacterized protein n=1 Tax=Litorivita pollutaquae TaxID=2200892 RepID=A0A2V4N4I9_9RHOB|nr:hypothetical protein DI396_01690 [Litorivita pollutaquae]